MDIKELENSIRRANTAYWNDNIPVMSDTDYDKLVEQLKKLDPNNKLLEHIGGTKGKYRHRVPMLSLNKAYSKEEILKWTNAVARSKDEKFYIQPKYDGLAGKIDENGLLVTRGDGTLGEDISRIIPHVTVLSYNKEDFEKKYTVDQYYRSCSSQAKVLYELNVHNLPDDFILGELIITDSAFDRYFRTGKIRRADGNLYSNSRNAVAGLVNQKEDIPDGLVTFVIYGCQQLVVTASEIEQNFDEYVQRIQMMCKDTHLPIDGLVFKLWDKPYRESLGTTAHHPRGQIAFKFTNDSECGFIKGVVWQSGKEVLTPVIVLEEPININGSNITRATAHNYAQFKIFDLHKGDRIKIERAGDVIPKIVEVDHVGSEKFEVPSKCPICNADTVIQGTDILCVNPACSGKIVPRMVAAAKLLRIDGFGPATCELIHDRLHVNELWQLLEMNYCKQIGYLPGFTDYTADILYKNLNSAVGNVYDFEVFAALCIPGIGLELSKKLFEKFDIGELSLRIKKNPKSIEDIIGPTRILWLQKAFALRDISICSMFQYFKPMTKPIVISKGKICLTGKFDQPKSYYKQIIESSGYQYTDTLTDDVMWLVTNDIMSKSSKMEKARAKGIEIISPETLLARIK